MTHYIGIFILFLLLGSSPLFPEWHYSGKNTFDYFYSEKTNNKYTQNKTALTIYDDEWRFEFNYLNPEQQPPFGYFIDYPENERFHYLVSYEKHGVLIQTGTFYNSLGKGLVFNNADLRDIKIDNNIMGVMTVFNADDYTLKLLSGRPYNSEDQKRDLDIIGLDLSKTVFESDSKQVTWGVTHAHYDYANNNIDNITAFSVYQDLYTDQGSLYYEYAKSNHKGALQNKNSHAHYVQTSVFLGNTTLISQYKDYQNFNLSLDNYFVQVAPTAIKTYSYTLPTKTIDAVYKETTFTLDNQSGYSIGSYSNIGDHLILELIWSQEESQDGHIEYNDIYGQVDYDGFDHFLIKSGLGSQYRDTNPYEYINVIEDVTWFMSDTYQMQVILEHQKQGRKDLPKTHYYSYTLSLSKANLGSLSYIREGDDIDNEVWDGVQLDLNVTKNGRVRAFVGKRQSGLRCIGGVCTNYPEFDGIELGWEQVF